MARYSYGPKVQARVKRLFAALLAHTEDTAYEGDHNLSIRRLEDNPHCLIIKTKRRFLETLPKNYDGQAKLKPAEVREALSHYLAEHLGILVDNRTETQGSEEWHFTLTLWSTDTDTNLQRFDAEWNAKRSDKSKQYLNDQTEATTPTQKSTTATTNPSIRIFVAYNKNVEPDASLATRIYEVLGQQHSVFIEQNLIVGTLWAETIETELYQADFVIALLSEESVCSEIFEREIRIAHQLSQQPSGKPRILPIRVSYQHQPLPYPLNIYLDRIREASWDGLKDTPNLLEKLEDAISGGILPIGNQAYPNSNSAKLSHFPVPASAASPALSVAPPVLLELPDGTMESRSLLYIERDSDQIALKAIQQQGKTISIKAPRQVGKSSLLNRITERASALGKTVVFIDFQLFEQENLKNADTFYKHLCITLTYELEIEDKVRQYWEMPLSSQQRFTHYVSKYLLPTLQQPLVIAMDEVERIFDVPYRKEFFGMLRTWHNMRLKAPIWRQLDLVFAISYEPNEFLFPPKSSPFSVGVILNLKDFSFEQVHELNHRYGEPLNISEEKRLMEWVNGHPFLVQRALYWIANNNITATELFAQNIFNNEPFGNHLKYLMFILHKETKQLAGLQEVFEKGHCSDPQALRLLQRMGLVRMEQNNSVVPRCRLYQVYIEQQLLGK